MCRGWWTPFTGAFSSWRLSADCAHRRRDAGCQRASPSCTAASSAGRDAAALMFVSTTAAFLWSPRNFARFIGHFRNLALNAA